MTLFATHALNKSNIACKLQIFFIIITLSFSAVVTNATGAQVTLAWDAATSSDIAGYRMHYGTSSGHYTDSIDAGQNTTCTIPNLTSSATYFFAVTAYTSNKTESGFSNEVSFKVPAEVTLSSIAISGPIQVGENSSAQYTCTAHYSDGSSAVLASGVSWSANPAAATIDSNGVLSTSSVALDTTVSVSAAYNGHTDTHSVTIKKTAAVLASLSISGPVRLDEESSGQYTCTARYSDNSTSSITDSVQWNVNSRFAVINASGRLTTRAVQSEEHVAITATFDGQQTRYDLIIDNSKSNYSLNVIVTGSGTVLLDPPGGIYDKGTVVSLTAEADRAWAFDGWTGAVENTESSTTSVIMDSDMELSATFLEDTDLDSVPDLEEWGSDSKDMGYDGNADGIADYLQGSVASLHTKNYPNYISLSAEEPGRITMCQTLETDLVPNGPTDHTFPLGLIAFRIEDISPGAGATLTIHLPAGFEFDTFYKYGPTLDDSSDHWYEFLYDQASETGAVVDNNTITLFLKDGSRGDNDLAANGVISDPGGPAILEVEPAPPGQQLSDNNPTSPDPAGGGSGCFIDTIITSPR